MSILPCLLYSLQAAFPYNTTAVRIAIFRCLPKETMAKSTHANENITTQLKGSLNEVEKGSFVVSQ